MTVTCLNIPIDPSSLHPSLSQRQSPASSVPQNSPFSSSGISQWNYPIVGTSSKSSTHTLISHMGSESTLRPTSNLKHLMYSHTSAPASRTPSLYLPAQPEHEVALDTILGQVARALDNVLSMSCTTTPNLSWWTCRTSCLPGHTHACACFASLSSRPTLPRHSRGCGTIYREADSEADAEALEAGKTRARIEPCTWAIECEHESVLARICVRVWRWLC